MTLEDLQRAINGASAAAPVEQPKNEQAERRVAAISLSVMLVREGRLPPWEAFDYMHGILQFMNSGTPFRFEKSILEK